MSELPHGWASTKIGDLCNLVNGKAFKPSDWTSSGLPIIRIQNLNRSDATFNFFAGVVQEKFLVKTGDLLFAWSGTPGTSFGAHIWHGPSAILNQHIFNVHIDGAVDKSFFRYAINQTLDEQIAKAHGGVGLRHVTKGKFEETVVALPPLSEQRRIVATLDKLSAKSRRARDHLDHIPRLVEKYKQAILATAFRDIEEDATESTLEQLASHITSGSRDWSQYYDRGNCVFVLAGNIKPMAFDPAPKQHVDPPLQSADAKRTRIEAGDLLFTIVGANTGDVCYVPTAVTDYFVCQSVALVRLHEPERARFIELFLNTETAGKAQIDKLIYGQGRPHLSFADLKGLRIPVIGIGQIATFVQRVDAAFGMVDRLASRATSARKLIDHLDQAVLAKAFRGELVPQDPNDEPASVLLERIRAERVAAPTRAKRGSRKLWKNAAGDEEHDAAMS